MKAAGSRFRTHGAVWLAVLAAIAGAMLALRRPISRLRAEIALEQAVRCANDNHSAYGPLASDAGRLTRWMAGWLVPPGTPADAAARALDWDSSDPQSSASASAIAQLLTGKPLNAIQSLETIASSRRNAAVWSNLGAFEISVAATGGVREHLLTALVDADHASTLDANASEPLFVRARALELLQLNRAALAAWRQYLDRNPSPAWAQIARGHVSVLVNIADDTAAWRAATAHADQLSSAELAALTRRYPQQARTFGEAVYLGEWADAVKQNPKAEKAALQRITTIANALRLSTGESFLADVIASIRVANNDSMHRIARAFLRYRNGRYASNEQKPAEALSQYEEARQLFSSLSNPMTTMTECYAAIALIDLNRTAEARQRLTALIAHERAAGTRHYALLAFALYHLALCDAAEGSWTESLVAAEESLSILTRLGERGLAGTVEALISQCYAFLGQRHLALQYGTHAVASLAAAGDWRRARITVGGLSRSSLRHGDWETARVLIEVEQLTALSPVSRDDCDTFLRLAAAEYHLGHAAAFQSALAAAKTAAANTPDPAIREKLTADTDAVAGALMRHNNPRSAIALLSAAIHFQEEAERALLLPELFLERGRANAALGRLDEADADFERGIEHLEQQRTRIRDTDLRSGIFDDAAELFASAVALSLAPPDPDEARAFAYVERGRARAIAEEIASRDQHGLVGAISVQSAAKSLPAEALILEYQMVDDGVVILTLDRGGLTATRIAVARATVEQEVRTFVEALREARDTKIVEDSSARLFARLLAPVRGRLEGAQTLVVVPDAILQQVPFAALFDPNTRRYLVEDHVILMTPSASIFAMGVRRVTKREDARPGLTALLVANPRLEGGTFADLDPLPRSESEARNARRAYAGGTVLTGAAGTVQRFVLTADSYDIVHFAGHTVIRPIEPWHSALLLASDRGDRGLLTVQQIAHLSFRRTRTVVLASCSTLRGHTAGVEGVPSVARAFLLAGVPSVIGTLWDVDDGEAAPIVEALHGQLARGVPAADALRASQLKAIHDPKIELRHPSRWSSFAVLATREALEQ